MPRKTRKPRKPLKPRKRTTRSTRKDTKATLPLKSVLAIVVLLVLAGLGLHSYQQYKTSQVEQEGLVVCGREGVCEKSMHIHSALVVSICGEVEALSKDTGQLADIHTHKQSNVLHFHERLKVTREGEVLDWTPLTLKNSVEQVTGMKLTNECIGEFCNGDRCPNGRAGKLSLNVVPNFCSGDTCPDSEAAEKALNQRGEAQEEIAGYVWKDGELLNLTFE